ncbi:MAG: hypothetical protein IIA54_09135 [Chloroflexi bacterium]|nr:hypothetical protein [Chloroflexota bacterium]
MSIVVFALILLVIAAAVGVPVLARSGGRGVTDADAAVLGAVVLTLGLGGLNLAFVLGNALFGDFGASAVLVGLAPVLAGALGQRVVGGRMRGAGRALALAAAAVLTLAGIPGYFALPVAVVTSAIAALAFLVGLTDPRALLRRLDPRG